jgi:hypothetical protein
MMNKELKTMEEKMKLDPNELMENGMTRAQNEEIQKGADQTGVFLSLISIVCALYALYLVFSL